MDSNRFSCHGHRKVQLPWTQKGSVAMDSKRFRCHDDRRISLQLCLLTNTYSVGMPVLSISQQPIAAKHSPPHLRLITPFIVPLYWYLKNTISSNMGLHCIYSKNNLFSALGFLGVQYLLNITDHKPSNAKIVNINNLKILQ